MSFAESLSASDAALLLEGADLGAVMREAQVLSLELKLGGWTAESEDAEVVSSKSGFWRANSW